MLCYVSYVQLCSVMLCSVMLSSVIYHIYIKCSFCYKPGNLLLILSFDFCLLLTDDAWVRILYALESWCHSWSWFTNRLLPYTIYIASLNHLLNQYFSWALILYLSQFTTWFSMDTWSVMANLLYEDVHSFPFASQTKHTQRGEQARII